LESFLKNSGFNADSRERARLPTGGEFLLDGARPRYRAAPKSHADQPHSLNGATGIHEHAAFTRNAFVIRNRGAFFFANTVG